jgi:Flp pilus assembly protein TadD
LGQHEEAIAWGRRGVQGRGDLAPHHQRAYGGALLNAGRPQEALAPLQRAAQLEPGKAQNLFNLGVALWQLGRGQEAARWLEQAVSLDPAFGPRVQALTGAP